MSANTLQVIKINMEEETDKVIFSYWTQCQDYIADIYAPYTVIGSMRLLWCNFKHFSVHSLSKRIPIGNNDGNNTKFVLHTVKWCKNCRPQVVIGISPSYCRILPHRGSTVASSLTEQHPSVKWGRWDPFPALHPGKTKEVIATRTCQKDCNPSYRSANAWRITTTEIYSTENIVYVALHSFELKVLSSEINPVEIRLIR